jgi:hypothetical protein
MLTGFDWWCRFKSTAQEVNLVELIIMSLLVILSVEVSPGMMEENNDTILIKKNTGEALKCAGAHDKGSWYSDITTQN